MFYNKFRNSDGGDDVRQGKVTSGSEYLHTKSITIPKPLIGNEADLRPELQPQPQPQPPPAEHNVCCTWTERKCKQQSCHVIYSKHIFIGKRCTICTISWCILAGIILIAAVIVCGYLVYVHWPQLTKSTGSINITLFIPPFSVVEVDPDKYNIGKNNLSKNNLVINADDHLVLIAASATTNLKNISLPVNDITLGEGKSYSLLRNWAANASGTITTHECHMTCKWGNLKNPPANDNDCDQNLIPTSSPNSSLQKVYELDEILKTRRSHDYNVALITFCGNNSTNSKVEFNITESLHIPNKNATTIIYASQQEIVVPKKYKLYIDTRHIALSSEEDYGKPVKIELQQANERDDLIIIISSVGGGMLVLFLFTLILTIVAFICFFTFRRNNLFPLGIAYHNNNNNN